jgi:Protein of unknown function (DUF3108)
LWRVFQVGWNRVRLFPLEQESIPSCRPNVRELVRANPRSASAPEGRRAIIVLGVFLFLALVAFIDSARWETIAAQAQRSTAKQRSAPVSQPKEQPVPFRAGETLIYRISWSIFSNAASLEISAPGRVDFFGGQVWHFRGNAHTLNSVRTLFPIDDQFDSYTDTATLDSRQFETHLNEMGKSTSQVSRFQSSGKPSTLPPPIVVVPPGTRDPLGAVYALRGVDWRRVADFHAPIFDGHDIFDLRASRESAEESVKVAAGTYSAWHLSLRVFQNQKEVSQVRYRMWIASDAARTPVLMEADLPFGTIRAELAPPSQ